MNVMILLKILGCMCLGVITTLCHSQAYPVLCTQQKVEYLVGGGINQKLESTKPQNICNAAAIVYESSIVRGEKSAKQNKSITGLNSKLSVHTYIDNSERRRILLEELRSEKQALNELKISPTPIPRAGTYEEQLNRYMANISALEAEISRLK
jgi:hypothetical protein